MTSGFPDMTAPSPTALATGPQFELKLHEIPVEDLEPNGDRYVVEVIPVDEKVKFGKILVYTPPRESNPMNPMEKATEVEERGVLAAVIITKGNGHLLGIPDWAITRSRPFANLGDVDEIERVPADVPMRYNPGDIVLVDFNARGRSLKMVGRTARIINNIDILSHVKNRQLRREGNTWVLYSRKDEHADWELVKEKE